ncbi:hypothetical protein PIB30_011412 [Stylosanthes scabra]|uniref:Uncharacterized protein n=1 Tax=Stylosanthes scabra TaxID=79078 RepID=A0ABU6Z4X9_9FABA|nr:hypothetical protein [Stylosanthes scabra]
MSNLPYVGSRPTSGPNPPRIHTKGPQYQSSDPHEIRIISTSISSHHGYIKRRSALLQVRLLNPTQLRVFEGSQILIWRPLPYTLSLAHSNSQPSSLAPPVIPEVPKPLKVHSVQIHFPPVTQAQLTALLIGNQTQ